MTKAEFLAALRQLYLIGNAADQPEADDYQPWTKPGMAGDAFCRAVDGALNLMWLDQTITTNDLNQFYG